MNFVAIRYFTASISFIHPVGPFAFTLYIYLSRKSTSIYFGIYQFYSILHSKLYSILHFLERILLC